MTEPLANVEPISESAAPMSEDGVVEFRDAEDVLDEAAGEADGTGTDHGNFNGHGKRGWVRVVRVICLCGQYR